MIIILYLAGISSCARSNCGHEDDTNHTSKQTKSVGQIEREREREREKEREKEE